METNVVFVHGWSVTHTNTYGGLPERLVQDARRENFSIKTRSIHLGRYISFHDEVRVQDIARAFEAAIHDQLRSLLASGERFVCITHSTGGPIIREWWRRYYQQSKADTCPMSHLIMLAPANYGSALAVLGKGKVSRLNSWAKGVEPGQGVLDWLALGSEEAWDLNLDWIQSRSQHIGPQAVFPFVITGQQIDRKLYDNLNSYTGELGSDGVVRVAAANLKAHYVRLVQQAPIEKRHPKTNKLTGSYQAPMVVESKTAAADTALRIVRKRSHSGSNMGIMGSIRAKGKKVNDSQEVIDSILSCIRVQSKAEYTTLKKQFQAETRQVQKEEELEVVEGMLWGSTDYFHDQFSMVIFRIRDNEGYAITDFDLILTAGEADDANHLPPGFFVDRQLNAKHSNIVTYYFNHSLMTGSPEVIEVGKNGKPDRVARPKKIGTTALGFKIIARPDSGFAHYVEGHITASKQLLSEVLLPNTTTMVDIILHRVVRDGTFALDKGVQSRSFKNTKPGNPIQKRRNP